MKKVPAFSSLLWLAEGILRQQAVRPVVGLWIVEKLLEQGQGLLAQDMGDNGDLHFLVQGRQGGEIKIGAAAHGIFVGVDDGPDIVEDQGGKTHEAGLHGGVDGQGAVVHSLVFLEKAAQGRDLGMVQLIGVVAAVGAVPSGHYLVMTADDAAHREFTPVEGLAGLDKGFLHILDVVVGHSFSVCRGDSRQP